MLSFKIKPSDDPLPCRASIGYPDDTKREWDERAVASFPNTAEMLQWVDKTQPKFPNSAVTYWINP